MAADDRSMEMFGRIQDGVVVLDPGMTLPEGTRVYVAAVPTQPAIETRAGELPIVRGGIPGSVGLTNERINEIIEEEDIATLKDNWNVPS